MFSLIIASCAGSDTLTGSDAPAGSRTPADSIFGLSVGDCFNDPQSATPERFMSVEEVDCYSVHDNEVTGILSVSFADHNNNISEINVWTSDACIEQLEEYVGAAYQDTPYVASPLFQKGNLGGYAMSESFFGGEDPHDFLCFLFGESLVSLTSSARNTG